MKSDRSDGMEEEYSAPISRVWRLADQLSVVEAALLIIGIEPQGVSAFIENWSDERKPPEYLAARQAIASGMESGSLSGQIETKEITQDFEGSVKVQVFDADASKVEVKSLISFLDQRGFETDAFGEPESKNAGFRDANHARYSSKLVAVVDAWEQFDEESNEVGTPKQKLMKWLRLNANRYGLTDDQGIPSENVIEELAKVANWATTGGAPRTKTGKPEPQ